MQFWIVNIICGFCVSVILAGVIIPQILLIAFRKNLFDEPDERKIHHIPVPRLGGLAFTPVIFFTMALLFGANQYLGNSAILIDFARNVLGVSDAHSAEFKKDCTPVIGIISDCDSENYGGTLRLGAYPCEITPDTLAHQIYTETKISERHRHRYEMDISLEQKFASAGMIISGRSPDGKLPEIVELKDHPFFIAGQFHPEFQSSPYKGHPMFNAFIDAAKNKK